MMRRWRTEETRLNLDAFARFAREPNDPATVEAIYHDDCTARFGERAGTVLAPILARIDRERLFGGADSPEYFPYNPRWGRVDAVLRSRLKELLSTIDSLRAQAEDARHRANLDWLAANLQFTLLLDEVGQKLEPAYTLKDRRLAGKIEPSELLAEKKAALSELTATPIEQLFQTYAGRVRSQGELGVLSSLNQKLWLQYKELDRFLRNP